MATKTFLKLPQEKRERILEAAWAEFETVSFAEASINRIIRRAGISRGSFYQYFTDKEDLFIYLMDEVHTPDSSRYFYAEGYEERLAKGEHQRQLSKEFVREWLMANGFQGQEGQKVPDMTPEVVAGISDRYIELYEHITGDRFQKADYSAETIEANVKACLEGLK